MGEQKEGILHGGFDKMSDEQEGPLEIQILRNIQFVDTEGIRMWCDAIILDPPCTILPDESRTVRGYDLLGGNMRHVFTRFYGPGETAKYLPDQGAADRGILIVGDEQFRITGESTGIINETKTFDDGYTGLWDYLKHDE